MGNAASGYRDLLDSSIIDLTRDAFKIAVRNPSLAAAILRMVHRQNKAAKIRRRGELEGIQAPPFMVASITEQCNLHCKGCYEKAQRRAAKKDLSNRRLTELFHEARDLGISFILVAGGEPLLRKDILPVLGNVPEVIFPLFTNGLLIDEGVVRAFEKHPNIVPILSLEGRAHDTDMRRGEGIHAALHNAMALLRRRRIFFGASLTVTRSNFATLTDAAFVDGMAFAGCSVFVFVEYVPVKDGTADWALLPGQNAQLHGMLESFRRKYPALFIGFPGDEERYGGCLSAGRGFVHVSAGGDLEPCPFSPYSDVNIAETPLKEALRSELLQKIRANHAELKETKGGCALWEKREWVGSLVGQSSLSGTAVP